jgi:protein-disulfide isomerase
MTSNNPKAASRAQKAAELRAEQERQERRRRMLTIGGVAALLLLLVGGIVGFSIWQQNEKESDIEAAAGKPSEYGVAIGPEDAPHTVIVYEDFVCSHCAHFEEASQERLAELAGEGKVRVEYRPFNLLGNTTIPNAFAVVLEESGPEVAKEYHDVLFAHQDEFLEEEPDADRLVELAVEAGAEEDAVRPGIEGQTQTRWVEEATAAAAEAGVDSTPTVLLDGQLFTDWRDAEELAENVVEAVQ